MNTTNTTNIDDILLPLTEVKRLTGFGRSAIYAMIRSGRFPAQHAIPGTNRVRWSQREVMQWIDRVLHRSDETATIAA